jgi:hypothetical protein
MNGTTIQATEGGVQNETEASDKGISKFDSEG